MIFERKFTYKSPSALDSEMGESIEIKAGLPYFPSKTLGMEMLYACPVQLYPNTPPHESIGIYPMQAMGVALSTIHIFLGSLADRGELRWEDGRIYNHEHESPVPMEKQLSIVHLKSDIKFE